MPVLRFSGGEVSSPDQISFPASQPGKAQASRFAKVPSRCGSIAICETAVLGVIAGDCFRSLPLTVRGDQESQIMLYIYIYFFSGVSFRLREARTAPDDRVIIVVPTRDEIPFTPYR